MSHTLSHIRKIRPHPPALGVGVATCCDFSVATIGDMLTLVHDADVVISLHGAGLINAIFSKPKVRVVHPHPGTTTRGHYPNVSLYNTGPII